MGTRNFTVPKSRRLVAMVVVAVVVVGGLAYTFVLPELLPAIRGPRYSVSVFTTTVYDIFANTTVYGECVPEVLTQGGTEEVVYSTCDYIGDFNVNVTCTGCSFNGLVGNQIVSGTGNKAYNVGGFPSWPFSFAWTISKNTTEGLLEVKVGGTPGGLPFYDQTTNAPYHALSGSWGWALIFVSGSVSTIT